MQKVGGANERKPHLIRVLLMVTGSCIGKAVTVGVGNWSVFQQTVTDALRYVHYY